MRERLRRTSVSIPTGWRNGPAESASPSRPAPSPRTGDGKSSPSSAKLVTAARSATRNTRSRASSYAVTERNRDMRRLGRGYESGRRRRDRYVRSQNLCRTGIRRPTSTTRTGCHRTPLTRRRSSLPRDRSPRHQRALPGGKPLGQADVEGCSHISSPQIGRPTAGSSRPNGFESGMALNICKKSIFVV